MPEEFDAYRKWLGIPPEDQPPHHYRLLGIAPFEDDPDVIENAFNRQMAYVRTFQSGKHSLLSQQILNELSTAKRCLLTPDRKVDYDAELRAGLSGVESFEVVDVAVPPVAPPPPRNPQPVSAAAAIPVATVPLATVPLAKVAASPLINLAPAAQPIIVGRLAKTGRPAAARVKRRSPLLPIVLVVVGVLALCALLPLFLVVTGGVVMNMNAKNASGDARQSPGDAKSTKRDKEGSSTQKPEKKNSGKPPERPEKELPFKPSPPIAPAEEPRAGKVRKAALGKALAEARQSMQLRHLDGARRRLSEAEEFTAGDRDEAEIEHLRVLASYLDNFWKAVRLGIEFLDEGKTWEFKDAKYEFVHRDGDIVVYKVDGTERKSRIRDLEPIAALAFASLALDTEDTLLFVYLGTFLAFDSYDGKERPEWQLKLAKDLWREAARRDVKNEHLAKELGIDASAEPKPGKTPEANSKLQDKRDQ